MQYKGVLIAVKDMERSKRFYAELFDQEVTMDLGKNVTLSGGFFLQEGFPQLMGLDEHSVVWQPHNMELYFETEDFDGFLRRLEEHPEARLVHGPKKYPWQQRVVRLYDPDGHIIEVGEAMDAIARRYLREGFSVQETAAIIQHPVSFVEGCRG